MMIKITVTDTPIREMKGIGKTSGKPYHMRIQTVYAHTMSPEGVMADFPDKFELALDDGQNPFPRGVYTLAPSSVFVSRDGKLDIRPRLVPIPAKAAA